MGLDFGFDVISKKLWESFDGDKQKYYDYFSWASDNDHEDERKNLVNWCGRGNPIEQWLREGLNYYEDYDGVLMRAITPEDLYHAIKMAKDWMDRLDLKPVVMGRAFRENDNGDLTIMRIDGVEVMDEDQAYHRIYTCETEERLFMTKEQVGLWDIYHFQNFVDEIMTILLDMNWDNDVLLYYVSY